MEKLREVCEGEKRRGAGGTVIELIILLIQYVHAPPHLPSPQLFFVVLLQPPQRGTTSPLPETTDPDYIISCDLMDGREAFLTMAQERHWEFSSLCRAKYSTMAMLYELHKQISDHFMYTCNHCHLLIETSYHCQECNVSITYTLQCMCIPSF